MKNDLIKFHTNSQMLPYARRVSVMRQLDNLAAKEKQIEKEVSSKKNKVDILENV